MDHRSAHILILDDDAGVTVSARMLLRRRYASVQAIRRPEQLDAALREDMPDVVLLDLNFTPSRTDGGEGLDLLVGLLSLPHPPAVIMMTAYADVALAVEALKRGATDFITKPWDNEHLLAAIESALAQRFRREAQYNGGLDAIVAVSPVMHKLKSIIANAAPTDANVLILGENGVGKELVAQSIHAGSARRACTFLAVDMGAIPESTFESELFGHRKGAFTDARNERLGRFQAASGGTLFLDEIGNLPLASQAKLLAALERRQVTPVGADGPEPVNVRIVSATNLSEVELFNPALFRQDLLFRLNTIVIRVPPLRERPEDIPLLLRYYLDHYREQYQRPQRIIDADALARLTAYSWPGNVRALRHACERAVIFSKSSCYEYNAFCLPDIAHQAQAVAAVSSPAVTEEATLGRLEREAIAAVLARTNGNISRAAKLLGISRNALYRKMEKHDL